MKKLICSIFILFMLLQIIPFALPTAAATELPPTPVKVAGVKIQDVAVNLHGVGHVQGYKEIKIKSRINGKLEKVFIEEGAEVQKGDKLFEIEKKPYILAVEQAQANLEKAIAEANEARKIANISEKLYSKEVVAKEKMEQQEAEAAELKAMVKVARAGLATARQNLSYCTITAPVTGILGKQDFYSGSLVTAYQDILITLNQINKIKINFSLPGEKLQELQKYQNKNKLTVTIHTHTSPDKKLTGELTFINNQIDPQTGMFTLQAIFENKNYTFWPGQYAHATVQLTTRKDTAIIPARCLFNGPNKTKMVYVVNPNNQVELRPLKLGWYLGEQAVILSGLKKGETVVTEGIFKLYPSASVKVTTNKIQK